jgi:hypothetical protein
MSIRITIHDRSLPLIQEISKISRNQALDALDHAGTVIRTNIRSQFRQTRPSRFGQRFNNGNRSIIRESNSKFGMRFRRSNGDTANVETMESFINSWLSEKKATVVIGGKHKGFRSKIRRDGKIVGQSSYVHGVSNASFEILQKLNFGGELSDSYKDHIGGSGEALFKGVRYRRTDFIAKGLARSTGKVTDIMTKKLSQLIGRQINNTSVRAVVSTSKVG